MKESPMSWKKRYNFHFWGVQNRYIYSLGLCCLSIIHDICKMGMPCHMKFWRFDVANLVFAPFSDFFPAVSPLSKLNSSWTMKSSEEGTSDNFVDHIQAFQNHIWFMGVGFFLEVEYASWNFGPLPIKPPTIRFRLPFFF